MEGIGIQLGGSNGIHSLVRIDDLSFWTYHRRMAIVLYFLSILTDAVHAHDITQVFNSPGFQQSIPGVNAGHGPVGNINSNIIRKLLRSDIPLISAPYRES